MSESRITEDKIDLYSSLAFMTEETLTTISDLANRSRPPRRELARQIRIAQTGVTALKQDDTLMKRQDIPWVQEVISNDLDVDSWSRKWR